MANNKVVFAGETLMDVTTDTVTPEALAAGYTATNAAGQKIVGTMSTILESEDYPGCYYRNIVNEDSSVEVEWINPPLLANVEYRTSERVYGTYPVYTKLISFGRLPSKGLSKMVYNSSGETLQVIKCCGFNETDKHTLPKVWTDGEIHIYADSTKVYVNSSKEFTNSTCKIQLWYYKV